MDDAWDSEVEGEEPEESQTEGWSGWRKLLFRFAFVYFLLYVHPAPLNWIPSPRAVAGAFEVELPELPLVDRFFELTGEYSSGWNDLQGDAVDATASTLLGIEEDLERPLGSGDPTFAWIQLGLMAALSLLAALLWSLVDRRRTRHAFLAPWLWVLARYYLGFVMLGYGIVKVIPTQFIPPLPSRLVTELGHSSPMNMLWTFMGASTGYIVFSGLAEVTAGLLLFFRRTATLGALVGAGVMLNVFLLNLFYDVPVKLFSAHLLVFAVAIAVPDLPRVLAAFVLQRPTEPRDLSRPNTWYVGHVVRFVLVGTTIATSLTMALGRHEQLGERTELYGIWDVRSYRLDGEEVPPLLTDDQRWRALVVDGFLGREFVQQPSGELRRVTLTPDLAAGTLGLASRAPFDFALEGEELVLRGLHDRSAPRDVRQPFGEQRPVHPQLTVRMERIAAPATALVAESIEASVAPAEEAPGEEPEATGEPEADPDAVGESAAETAAEVEAPEPELEPESEPEPDPVPADLLGTWELVEHSADGELLSGRRCDPWTWTRLTLTADHVARVEFANGRVDDYGLTVQVADGLLWLETDAELALEDLGDRERLRLSGELRGHDLEVELERRPLESYLLVRRGFHWINEVPLNRY